VVDFKTAIDETLHQQTRIVRVECSDFDLPVFGLIDHPGSIFSLYESIYYINYLKVVISF
jgi:hypothetical protein